VAATRKHKTHSCQHQNLFHISIVFRLRCKSIPLLPPKNSLSTASYGTIGTYLYLFLFSLYFCPAAARIGKRAAEEKQYKDYDLLLSTHDGDG
jgi:hypothetical protein